MKVVTKIFDLTDFFENVVKTFSREELFELFLQSVNRDQINTLAHYFWIRLTRTIFSALGPLCLVIVTPVQIFIIYSSE